MLIIKKTISYVVYPIREIFEILIRILEIYPNTKLGYLLRNIIFKKIFYKYGKRNFISNNVSFRGRKKICISSSVHIATNTVIGSDDINGIFIGNNVYIGPNCVFRSSNHDYSEKFIPPQIQNYKVINLKKNNIDFSLGIIIEDNVWIGANCSILAGSHIKKGTIIGANSLVNKELESEGLYVGSPVKKLKNV